MENSKQAELVCKYIYSINYVLVGDLFLTFCASLELTHKSFIQHYNIQILYMFLLSSNWYKS